MLTHGMIMQKHLDFYVRNNQVVGYADLSFKKLIDKGILSEIVIKPSSRITKEDIIFLLANHRFNTSDIKV